MRYNFYNFIHLMLDAALISFHAWLIVSSVSFFSQELYQQWYNFFTSKFLRLKLVPTQFVVQKNLIFEKKQCTCGRHVSERYVKFFSNHSLSLSANFSETKLLGNKEVIPSHPWWASFSAPALSTVPTDNNLSMHSAHADSGRRMIRKKCHVGNNPVIYSPCMHMRSCVIGVRVCVRVNFISRVDGTSMIITRPRCFPCASAVLTSFFFLNYAV